MDQNTSLFEFEVDQPSSIEMTEMARWAKMFGILVIILMGLMILMFVAAWTKLENQLFYSGTTTRDPGLMVMGFGVIIFVFILIGLMMFFLVRGGNRLKKGLQLKDQLLFNGGLGDIRTFFIFYGVIALLGMVGTLTSLF